ncbi:hypothetical protein ZHAS_00010491 [Anopheles sinensis]|uniref:Uncharacterized protein n=1 Tax=Anopheles sinensis TaxID=74873 RepID=A0A084VXQ1_ANOSI|nr:hypothetical protein ZHAS_00010491 [Anopheles sinensis]
MASRSNPGTKRRLGATWIKAVAHSAPSASKKMLQKPLWPQEDPSIYPPPHGGENDALASHSFALAKGEAKCLKRVKYDQLWRERVVPHATYYPRAWGRK